MRKILSFLLVMTMMSMTCIPAHGFAENTASSMPDFKGLNDPSLLPYMEDTLYEELVSSLGSSEYFVENVSAIYISQEYLDELEYNSRANIFFGYTLAELNEQFQGTRYVFTLGDHDETVVQPFEAYDDTFDRVIHNVAVGTGVILVCVTVSVVTGGTAPAISMIFAVAAKTGTACALSGGALGGLSAGIVTGIQTGDMEAALKAAALGGSEGYKWGAISGALSGGTSEAIALKGATLNGLTMNEAAIIQQESHYSLDMVKNFHSMEEYQVYFNQAKLQQVRLGDQVVLGRMIDLDYIDDAGHTNAERIINNLSPLDPDGMPYELHHIGQKNDAPLAILTRGEHRQGDNNSIIHFIRQESEVEHGVDWQNTVHELWKRYLNAYQGS